MEKKKVIRMLEVLLESRHNRDMYAEPLRRAIELLKENESVQD